MKISHPVVISHQQVTQLCRQLAPEMIDGWVVEVWHVSQKGIFCYETIRTKFTL